MLKAERFQFIYHHSLFRTKKMVDILAIDFGTTNSTVFAFKIEKWSTIMELQIIGSIFVSFIC